MAPAMMTEITMQQGVADPVRQQVGETGEFGETLTQNYLQCEQVWGHFDTASYVSARGRCN